MLNDPNELLARLYPIDATASGGIPADGSVSTAKLAPDVLADINDKADEYVLEPVAKGWDFPDKERGRCESTGLLRFLYIYINVGGWSGEVSPPAWPLAATYRE